jgi:hypothetical protein
MHLLADWFVFLGVDHIGGDRGLLKEVLNKLIKAY